MIFTREQIKALRKKLRSGVYEWSIQKNIFNEDGGPAEPLVYRAMLETYMYERGYRLTGPGFTRWGSSGKTLDDVEHLIQRQVNEPPKFECVQCHRPMHYPILAPFEAFGESSPFVIQGHFKITLYITCEFCKQQTALVASSEDGVFVALNTKVSV